MAGESSNTKNYLKIFDKLSQKLTGISRTNADKYMSNNDKVDDVIKGFVKVYSQDRTPSIMDVKGKHKGQQISDILVDRMGSDEFKNLIASNMTNQTLEEIREQKYLRKYMPQIGKVLNDMRGMIMTPSAQTRKKYELSISAGSDVLNNQDIFRILKNKNFDDIVGNCIQSSLDHGAGFMYIYPYTELAKDVLTMADKLRGRNTVMDSTEDNEQLYFYG